MKISDIDAFAAVVRCQTLSQAAAELGMTQPAITRRVQNLEEALGVTLLDRNTKPPRPTDIGRQVFEQCRAILREVDALRELTAGQQPPAGEFRIGLTQGLGELMLPASMPPHGVVTCVVSAGHCALSSAMRRFLTASSAALSTGCGRWSPRMRWSRATARPALNAAFSTGGGAISAPFSANAASSSATTTNPRHESRSSLIQSPFDRGNCDRFARVDNLCHDAHLAGLRGR